MNRLLVPSVLLSLLACSNSASDGQGSGGGLGTDGGGGGTDGDGGATSMVDAGPGQGDGGPGIVCTEPSNLTRGQTWVRNNPLFVSGLTTSMPAPTAGQKSTYFDDFNANAAHIWLDGLPSKTLAWSSEGANRFLSWTRNDGTAFNGQVIGGIPANTPGRIGFQIGDEPRDMETLLELEQGFDNVRAVDPDALLILNFSFSADDIEGFLTYYGTQIDGDIFSYDRYSRSNRTLVSLESIRSAALSYDKPYWTWLRSYRGPGESNSSASDMRWNVYSHVLYGFTGFSWFLYLIDAAQGDGAIEGGSLFASDGSYQAAKTSAFDVAADLNAELVNIGPVITQLRSTSVHYISSLSFLQPDGTQAWSAGAGEDLYLTNIEPGGSSSDLMVGFFKDDCDQVYFMVQNPNRSGGSFPVGSASSQTVRLSFDFSGAPDALDTTSMQALDKNTGNAVEMQLTPEGANQATLSFSLDAGDAILLKYNTGLPFASQNL